MNRQKVQRIARIYTQQVQLSMAELAQLQREKNSIEVVQLSIHKEIEQVSQHFAGQRLGYEINSLLAGIDHVRLLTEKLKSLQRCREDNQFKRSELEEKLKVQRAREKAVELLLQRIDVEHRQEEQKQEEIELAEIASQQSPRTSASNINVRQLTKVSQEP